MTRSSRSSAPFIKVILLLLIVGCSDGGNKDGAASMGEPVDFNINFPFPHANYSSSEIGFSVDVLHPQPQNVEVVATAGVGSVKGSRISDSRFLIKGLKLSLEHDVFTIQVTASHRGGDSTTQSITLANKPDISSTRSLALDTANGRILLTDRYSASLFTYSYNTNTLKLVSGPEKGSGPSMIDPRGVTVDPSTSMTYVIDDDLNAIFRISQSGDRTIISSKDIGSGDTVLTPTDIVFDAARGLLFVSDQGRGAVHRIDPENGDRSIVTNLAIGSGPVISFRGMDLDSNGDQLLLFDSGSVIAVNPTTGGRSILSPFDPKGSISRSFTGISVASANRVAYLADSFSNAVVEVDLASGQQRSISSSGLTVSPELSHPVIGSGTFLEFPNDVLYDENQNRLFVVEELFGNPLLEVDLNTGDRRVVVDGSIGAGINFKGPADLSLDTVNQVVYLVDPIADIVVEIDLTTGNRRLLDGNANDLAYVLDLLAGAVYSVDLSNGNRRLLSSGSEGAGPEFRRPVGMDLDAENNRLFVSDSSTDSIYIVDINNGQRSIVSSNSIGLGQGFRSLGDIAWDNTNNRLLAIDTLRNAIFSVDVSSGEREIISGDSSLLLLVKDEGTGALRFVDIPRKEGGGLSLATPRRMQFDSKKQIAYITDDAYDGVIAVDVTSGYRQLIAR